MKQKHFLFSVLLLIFSNNSQAQSCEIFEIPNVNVYLYPLAEGISTSKLNDSVSYSIEKVSSSKFRIQKLLFEKVIETNYYKYKGKTRIQVFKVKKRKGEEISFIKKKKKICVLE